MSKSTDIGRPNQRLRTRKDILAAAARLLRQGLAPSMEDVAAEAMVSRATIYRYFPTIEGLLVEAPLDGVAPEPAKLFAGDASTDPFERAEKAESALHEMTWRNAAQLRLMLAASLQRALAKPEGVPIRQNRRTPLIEAALAPARSKFSPAQYQQLCASLAMIFGPESMIVFSDVLGQDEKTARKVKRWATRALITAALEQSGR